MKRFEIYINSNGSLTIDAFKRNEDEYAYSTYRGNAVYELIRKLAIGKPTDVVENRIRDNISIEYENYIINLNEPHLLLNKKGLGPLMKCISLYYEQVSKKIVKNKKVTRKNKHSGKKIIAAGFAVLLIGTIAYNIPKNQNELDLNINEEITITETYENNTNNKNFNFVIDGSTKEKNKDSIFIEYEDRSSAEKVYITRAYYGNLIEKYAKQYGLDVNLVLAIATQERGIHSEKKDFGGATGLMQIQNSVWENKYISAYNYENKNMENVYVTTDKIKNIHNNIKFGCMYLQNCMEYMDYNVMAAVQCYNMGYGNVMKVLEAYSNATNKSVKDILNDPNDTGWLEYRKIIDVGDKEYIEHVFSWIGSDFNIENKKTDNSSIEINVVNQEQTEKIY